MRLSVNDFSIAGLPVGLSVNVFYTIYIMKEIDYPDMRRANNGAHIQFMRMTLERLDEAPEVMKNAVMKRAAEALKAAVDEESLYLGQSRKSLLTGDIKAADKERDELLTGFRATVRGLRHMSDREMAHAAEELLLLLDSNKVARGMQLDRETGMIAKLISELERNHMEKVDRLNMRLYVTALKAANERLNALLVERSESRMWRKPAAMQQARVQTDAAFRQVARVANAMAVLEDEAVVAPFIDFVNEMIRRYRQQVFPKRKKKAAEE